MYLKVLLLMVHVHVDLATSIDQYTMLQSECPGRYHGRRMIEFMSKTKRPKTTLARGTWRPKVGPRRPATYEGPLAAPKEDAA